MTMRLALVTEFETDWARGQWADMARVWSAESPWCRVVEDPATGARVGIPSVFATEMATAPTGTRWSSAQGQLQIETFRIDTGATLEAVFEQQKKLPRRRVTSSSMQADSFSISGMQGLKKMVVRGYTRDDCTGPREPGLRQPVRWRGGREAIQNVAGPIRLRVGVAGIRPESP